MSRAAHGECRTVRIVAAMAVGGDAILDYADPDDPGWRCRGPLIGGLAGHEISVGDACVIRLNDPRGRAAFATWDFVGRCVEVPETS